VADEGKVAAEFDFRPEVVRVSFDEPWVWPRWRWLPWRLRGRRRRNRAYVIRPRAMRELMLEAETWKHLADFGLDLRVASIVGPSAMFLPRSAIVAIWDAYCRVNLIPTTESAGGASVTFDQVLRRLERDPFNLSRDAILDLTARQIEARLSEWGEERVEQMKAEAAVRGVG
jgi:hypothetical protein